ncbi:MAG: hypothetical protein AB7P03_22960 [Kofleriaceae bacterium]
MRWVSVLILLLIANGAGADSTPPVTSAGGAPTTERYTSSYRAQTLFVDFTAILLVPLASKDGFPIEIPLGTYVLGAPIVHVAHGRPGRAMLSLGLRLVMPFGLALAAKESTAHRNEHPEIRVAIAGITGALIASLVDTAVLADGDSPPKPLPVAPTVQLDPHNMTLGVAGSF